MKILIPLTILVISFIIYFFFTTPVGPKVETSIPLDTSKLEYRKEAQKSPPSYVPNLATIKSVPTPSKTTTPQKEYLTLDDLKKGPKQDKHAPHKSVPATHNFNQIIFQQLKLLLQQSSSTYYAKKPIVLNSRISSILPSQDAREIFKSKIASDFGLDDETIEEQMRKNRTVWDWVIFLSP